jgi:hypothetical protein
MYRLGLLGMGAVFLCACASPSAPSDAVALCERPPLAIEHSAGEPAEPIVHVLDQSAYPSAVCNDGTPATYVLRPGFGDGTRRWLIYLEGGGECADAEHCQTRYTTTRAYMTSEGSNDGAVFDGALEGIKSTNPSINPDFYDVNLVQVRYCSSDLWSGDTEGNEALPTSDMARWHFRGRSIVEAVLEDLREHGLDDAREVLLAGSSAGGVGVVHRADDVAARLPASARFLALADAGFFIDYPSFDPATSLESTDVPTERQLELTSGVVAWGGGGDADCEAAASGLTARVLCRSVFDVVHGGHVETRLFFRQSELDAIQLKLLGLAKANKTAAANAYRARFVTRLVTNLELLANVGVFATRDDARGVVNDNTEWQSSNVASAMLPATFGAWYRDPCGVPSVSIAP